MNLSISATSILFLGLSCTIGCGDSSGDGAGGATSSGTTGSSKTVTSGATTVSATAGGGPGIMHACNKATAFICEAGDANPLTDDQCNSVGGMASPECPTTGLIGCCTITNFQNCYYQGGAIDAVAGKASCKQKNGTWSTAP